jgi:hypothetical protein
VTEVVDTYEHATERRPLWIVVCQGWAWRYLIDVTGEATEGRVPAATQRATNAEIDGTGFFRGLVRGERGYALAHTSAWTSERWPRLDIHASTARETWIFRRVD